MDPKWILNDLQKKQRFSKFFEKKEKVWIELGLRLLLGLQKID